MAETRYVFRMAAALAGREGDDSACMAALVDGRVLADLLLRLDRRYFGRALLATTGPATGVLRVALLRRMHMRMLAYGREVLGEDWSRLPTPDIGTLGRAPFKTTALPDGPLFDSAVVLGSSAPDLWDGFMPEAVVAMRTLCLIAIHAAIVADGPLRREVFALLDALIHDPETRIGIESWLEEFRAIILASNASPPLTPVAVCADKASDPVIELRSNSHLVDPKPKLRMSHVIGVQSQSDSTVSDLCAPEKTEAVVTVRRDASVGVSFERPMAVASVCAVASVSDAAVETDRQPPVQIGPNFAVHLAESEAVQLRLRIRCDEAEMSLAVQAERERIMAEAWSEREASLTAALASQMERAMNAEAALSAAEDRAARLSAELARTRSMHVSVLSDLERARSERAELLDRLAATLTSVEESSCALGELEDATETARIRAAGLEERLAWTTQTYQADAKEMEVTIAEQAAMIAQQNAKIADLEMPRDALPQIGHLCEVLRNRNTKLAKAKRSLAQMRAAQIVSQQKLMVAMTHRRRLSRNLRKLWKRYYALVHASKQSVPLAGVLTADVDLTNAVDAIERSNADEGVQTRIHQLEMALAAATVTVSDAQHRAIAKQLEHDAAVSRLNTTIDALSSENDRLCSDASLHADLEAAKKAERKMHGLVESLSRDLAVRVSSEARMRQRLADMTLALEAMRVDVAGSDTANMPLHNPLRVVAENSFVSTAVETSDLVSGSASADFVSSVDFSRSDPREIDALKHENAVLRKELEELDARLAEFRNDLEMAECEEAERDKLIAERDELKEKLEAASANLATIADLEQRHDDIVAHLSTVVAERDELIAAEVELLESMDDLQQQLDDALAAKDVLSAELAKLASELCASELRSEQLACDLDEAATARCAVESDLEQTQAAFARLGNECTMLRRKASLADTPPDSAVHIAQLLEELGNAAEIESDLQMQIADLDARRRAAEAALEQGRNAAVSTCVNASCATDDDGPSADSNQYGTIAASLGGHASTADELRALVASIRREHRAILAAWHALGSHVYRNSLATAE